MFLIYSKGQVTRKGLEPGNKCKDTGREVEWRSLSLRGPEPKNDELMTVNKNINMFGKNGKGREKRD